MVQAFHLSFVVPNKELARKFYIEILGCSLGRDNETWFDILFYGHQLTIHQASSELPSFQINHFGPILNKKQWQVVVERCTKEEIEIILPPTIKNEFEDDESGKFTIKDPSGNTLEFKYYSNFSKTVG